MERKVNYRNVPLSETEKAEIVDCYLRLGNQALVAAELHHSHKTVSKVLKAEGYACGRGGNKKSQMKISDAQILEAISAGLTRKEIADKYGVHPENLTKRMRKLGVHAVKKAVKKSITKKICDDWHFVESHKTISETLQPNFEYLETLGNKRRIRLKCRKCGGIAERAYSTVRQKNVICEDCEKKQKSENNLKHAQQDLINVLLSIKEAKTPKQCVNCGRIFYSQYSNQLYCSGNCKSKKKGNHTFRKRCRKYGVYFDSSIKKVEILKRDKYTCKICGKICNPNDKRWGTSGPDYPTIDHIIPLARGGKHIEQNLQCACGMCNSNKRDLLDWEDAFDARVIKCS